MCQRFSLAQQPQSLPVRTNSLAVVACLDRTISGSVPEVVFDVEDKTRSRAKLLNEGTNVRDSGESQDSVCLNTVSRVFKFHLLTRDPITVPSSRDKQLNQASHQLHQTHHTQIIPSQDSKAEAGLGGRCYYGLRRCEAPRYLASFFWSTKHSLTTPYSRHSIIMLNQKPMPTRNALHQPSGLPRAQTRPPPTAEKRPAP